jgi:hypothetical protein
LHRGLVFYSFSKNSDKNSVIYRIEEFSDIAFQYKTWRSVILAYLPRHAFKSRDAPMRAKSDAAGKRTRDECRLENGIDNGKYGVMQNAITHQGFMDMSLLRIMNVKAIIRPVPISPALQFPM